MGFWGSIVDFGKDLFTGGGTGGGTSTAQKIMQGIQTAGSVAGSIAKGREAGRDKEILVNSDQDKTRLAADRNYEQALIERAALDLQRREDSRASETDAYRKAMASALALNMRDAAFNRPDGVPNISLGGGARPSAIGAQGREAAEILNRKALENLLAGSNYDELPGLTKSTVTAAPKASVLDHILGAAGTIGGVLERNDANAGAKRRESLIEKILAAANTGTPKPTTPPFVPTDEYNETWAE